MSGKRAFLDVLKQEGVEIIFGNPGTTELPLMDAFATENELRYLLGLQEAAVMAMADGYAQASGKLAVVTGGAELGEPLVDRHHLLARHVAAPLRPDLVLEEDARRPGRGGC